MYLSFYGLHKKPFQINTNPSFFWFGKMHKEALALLKYGITENKGFLLLTGDVGTGKTTLINALINSLGDDVIVAKVPDPGLEMIDFMNYISHAFELEKRFLSKEAFLVQFGNFLTTAYSAGKKVLLIIDESQRLSTDLLEEIRQLSNIEKQATKLLNILFIGQNEFNDVLLENRNRALHQRIAINYAIRPFDFHETGEFVRQSLKYAGTEKEIFSPDAIRCLYEFSGGFLRRINIICDHVMLAGYFRKTKTITGEMVKECVKELCLPVSAKTATVHLMPVDGHESEKIIKISPKNIKISPKRLRQDTSRTWRTIGIVNLVAVILFIVTYIYYPGEYQDLFNQIKNNGIQVFNVLWERSKPSLNNHAEPYRKAAIDRDSDEKYEISVSDVVPVKLSIERGLLVESVAPAVVLKDGISDAGMEASVSKIQMLGEGNVVKAHFPSIGMMPFQEKRARNVPEILAVLSETAIMLSSEAGQTHKGRRETAAIGAAENPIRAPLPAGKITIGTVTFEGSVFGKNKKEEKELANKEAAKKTASNYSEIAEYFTQKTKKDISDDPIGHTESKEGAKDKKKGYVDPGAVIDWVIKNRAQ
jgi:type II secretory pathway predicted ATPase ExeA